MNPLQSGDPPITLGEVEKLIRTLPRPDSPKLLETPEAKRTLFFALPALVIWLFSGLAYWVVGYTAAIVANISIGFVLGAGVVVFHRQIDALSRGRARDKKVSVLEFTPASWSVRRTDGSGAFGPLETGLGVRATKQELWFWAGDDDPWLLVPTDLENPGDWPVLIEWLSQAGHLRGIQKQRALRFS